MGEPLSSTWDRYSRSLVVGGGVTLDPSRVAFDDSLFSRLAEPLARAFDEMAALERGAIANPDEKRMVGHYWLRAPELAPDPAITQAITSTVARVREFAAGVRGRFTDWLLIGIGGSALGPQFVADALGSPGDPMQGWFFDNTDPDGMRRTLDRIGSRLRSTLVLTVSKSGGTKETRNGMLVAAAAFKDSGLDFARQAVAVTGEGSELDRHAAGQKWLARFPMWDWVGGRTSVLSPVGLLPAELSGFDTAAMLRGAARMDEATRVRDPRKNPAATMALLWHHLGGGRGSRDMVVLPYRDRLILFSRYLQQLVMESLGKELDRKGRRVHQGLAVYGNKGSTDQHAYVQQLRDGLDNFFVTFVEVLDDRGDDFEVEPGVTSGDYLQSFLLGTSQALAEKGRPSITITLERLDAASLGALVALFERTVGLYASLIDVNAYDQPGVEAGKKSASRVLAVQQAALTWLRSRSGKGFTAGEIATANGFPGEAETVFRVLARIAHNDAGIRIESGASVAEARFASH